MATIHYQFADGHFEDIEVTEEFKREYEFLEIQERAHYWKIKKQKQRAGLEVKYDLSLDRLCDDGQEPPACSLSPLDKLIEQEERKEYYHKLLAPLTNKQREACILKLKGYKQVQIAKKLNLAVSSVNERLQNAQKRILENFLKNPKK